MTRFGGRVALVTGAGGSIGRATALRLASEGAAVVVNDVQEEAAKETVALVTEGGGRAAMGIADVTRPDDVAAMVAAATDELGLIDILVNNAGGAPPGTRWGELRETTVDDFDGFLSLNLRSAFVCSRAVIDAMLARQYGKIVCVSSIAAVFGQRGGIGYASAKAGLAGFVASLAKEVAPSGINVNSIMIGNAPHPSRTPERQAQLDEWSHVRRVGQPEEFAAAIAFLASDDASYLSGSTLTVDGGTLRFGLM